MTMNIEAALTGYLSNRLDCPVGSERGNGTYVTLERTGGRKIHGVVDCPDVSVFCWAPSRYEASELAYRVDSEIQGFDSVPNVVCVSEANIYHSPVDDRERYQLDYTIKTK